jgi:tetratricopeptide (TPR) repeat protein
MRIGKKFPVHPKRKLIKTLFSILLISTFLISASRGSAQKTKEAAEATDFVLDLVALYLNVEKTDEAIACLEKLMDIYPTDYDIRLYMGMALIKKQDLEAAYKEFHEIERSLEWGRNFARYIAFSFKNKGLLYFGRGITSLMHKKDFKASKNYFVSALKHGYEETNVRYLLIYSYLRLKNYKKADDELNELLDKKEMSDVNYFIKGYLNYEQGRGNEAVFLMKKALEINPDLIEAKKNLAAIYYNSGKWEEAIEIWKSLIEKFPEDSDSRSNMAMAYFHLGRLDEAKQQFERLNISISVEDYGLKQIPLIFIPWKDWTEISIRYRVDYESLMEQKNLKKFKLRGHEPSRLAAVFLNEKALFVLKEEGEIEEAVKILNLAHHMDDSAYLVSYNLGQLYSNLENTEKAEEFARKAIQQKKDFLEAYDLVGNIHFKKGQYKEALKEFSRVIEISKDDAQGYYNLGCTYWALKDLNNAENAWKKAVEYEMPAPKRKMEKRFEQDGWGFTVIVRWKPVAYRAFIALGSLYETKGLIKDAIKEYDRAVKREPENPEAYFELGRIYFNRKSWKEAKFYLEKHINLGGHNQEKTKQLLNSLKHK